MREWAVQVQIWSRCDTDLGFAWTQRGSNESVRAEEQQIGPGF